MSIPTDIAWTNCVYARMPLNDHFQVFTAINVVRQIMEGRSWRFIGKNLAKTTMTFGGVVGSGGAFSTVILDFLGKGFKIFNSGLGERDPTGDATGVNDATFIGVDMVGITDDGARTEKFVAAMNGIAGPNWQVTISDGGPGLLNIDEIIHDDVQRNDFFWTANVLSGYEFNGPTKYGGWQLASQDANGISNGLASFWSAPTSNFVVQMTFDKAPRSFTMPPFYFANRQDAWMVISPYMWIFGNLGEPYTAQNIDEVTKGGSDWWYCNPRIVPTRLLDLIPFLPAPIEYCGFITAQTRDTLHDKSASIYMNSQFSNRTREEDCGLGLIPLNSMYHDPGALTTETLVPISYSSILGMTESDLLPELRMVGDIWDMYLVNKYYPLDSHFFRKEDNREVFSYRTQQAPCEVTLLCAFTRF